MQKRIDIAEQVLLVVENHAESLDIDARFKGVNVGTIGGLIDEQRLNLTNFEVPDDTPFRHPFLLSFLFFIFQSDRPKTFRGLGIGSLLIKRFIAEARKLDIQEIWGSVTAGDATQTPYLLDIYRKNKFTVTPADNECIDVASWKITLNL